MSRPIKQVSIGNDQKNFRRERVIVWQPASFQIHASVTHFWGCLRLVRLNTGLCLWTAKCFAIQLSLAYNHKLTRIQRRANRQSKSKAFWFWKKYENGACFRTCGDWWKNSGSIFEIDVEIKRTFKSRIISWYTKLSHVHLIFTIYQV